MESSTSDSPASEAGRTETTRGRGSGIKDRTKWANKTEFRLAMAGATIGLGSIWRVPYMFYMGGGGAFLIPYLLSLFFCGMPMFFLETALGQYTSESAFTAWRKICPMFQGIGITSQVITLYLSLYSSVTFAWILLYLYNAFKNPLPWSSCSNAWNTDQCWNHSVVSDWSFLYNNSADDIDESNYTVFTHQSDVIFPEEEFWRFRVSGKWRHEDADLGGIRWELALCLLLTWVLCYCGIGKGVRYIGKVIYFTVTFPFLLLFILFIRGVTLPGAWEGIKHFILPGNPAFTHSHVWSYALMETLYSHTVGFGVVTTLGSYNRYKHDCYNDCLMVCALSTGTPIFAGFVMFSLLGFGAHSTGLSISSIVRSDPDFFFVSVTMVLSLLPVPQLWCIIGFLMVFFFCITSQFLIVESLVTSISDIFPGVLRKPGGHELLLFIVVVICFLLGLPMVTQEGLGVVSLLSMFGTHWITMMFIFFSETIAIGWIYGADRFYDNIEDMIGYRPFPVIKYCWLFVIPTCCIVCTVCSLSPLWFGDWNRIICAVLMLLPLLCIPVFVLVAFLKNENNITTPASDLKQVSPHKPRLTLCKRVILRGRKSDSSRAVEEKPAPDSTTGV